MCYLDEGMRPLTKILPKEIGNAVLRNHIVHMGACYNYRGTLRQERHNSRLPFFIQRSHGNDWLPFTIGGNGGSSEKVNDATHTYDFGMK